MMSRHWTTPERCLGRGGTLASLIVVVVLLSEPVEQVIAFPFEQECDYYNTEESQAYCSKPGIHCVSFETVKIGSSCLGFPDSGCCSGKTRIFCDISGKVLCGADCGGAWTKCGKPGSNSPAMCTNAPNYWGDPVDCSDLEFCSCAERECGPGPCLTSCGVCPVEKPICTQDGKCVQCTPICTTKACGADGCGGDCGSCPEGSVCVEEFGQCCEPKCEGRDCGPDGCGGSCGACVVGSKCSDDGNCLPVPKGCSPGATQGCECECEACACQMDPFCCSVSWDAVCGSECSACGTACATGGCVPHCAGSVCGPYDGCGGSCGTCPHGTKCGYLGRRCLPCTCGSRVCGDDGCGGSCGECPDYQICSAGACVPRGCGPSSGPGCQGCGCEACVCSLDPYCCKVHWDSLCAEYCGKPCGTNCPCVSECEGRECGPSQCGFSACGYCTKPQVCMPDGWCCAPSCEGKECGSDGCYDFCGECGPHEVCAEGKCVCIPTCWGKECGSSGCGDPDGCGVCPSGEFCTEGECVPPYPASCLGLARSSAPDCPDGLSEVGCCDDAGRAVWCSEGQLYCEDCPSCSQVCGSAPDGAEARAPVPDAQRCVLAELRTTGAPASPCGACWAGCPAGSRCEAGECVAPEDVAAGDAGVADGGSSGPDAAAPPDAGSSKDVTPSADGASPASDTSPPADAGSSTDVVPSMDGASPPPDAALPADAAGSTDATPSADGESAPPDITPLADAESPTDAAPRADGASPQPDTTAPVDTVMATDAQSPGPDSAADAPPATETAPVPDAASPASDAAPGDVSGSCGGCRATGGPPLALLGLLMLAVSRRKRERPAPEHLDA